MNDEDHRAERKQEMARAIAAIEHALSAVEADNGEPDRWERTFLAQAINCLYRAAYRLATVDAQLALTPPNEQSPAADLNLPSDTFLDRCNLSVLRAALREAAAEPVRDHPTLGPIVLAR
jgi:hypothetical protein